MIEAAVTYLLTVLAISHTGLLAVFVVAFISATLLWRTLLLATLGHTLGGVVNYGLGYGAKKAFTREKQSTWFAWLQRYGAKTMLLAWLPVIGDPICLLGGWLRLPFWACVGYMAVGKFLRYLVITMLLLSVPDGVWHRLILMF
ncbi:MAG: DedA family protein [Burkholderiales bacterium]|nr:DedA family protein [Burkholderiales bacterium]